MTSPGYIPGPLVIPLTFQIRLLWALPNGVLATNVLHAIVPDDLVNSQAVVDDLYNAIAAEGTTATYFAFLAPGTSLVGLDIRDLRTADQAAFQSGAAATVGTGILDALPESTALVVTLRSGLAGRAHRGRIYLTGYDASATTSTGRAAAAMATAALAWIDAIIGLMGARFMDLGIGHRGHAEYLNRHGVTVPAEAAGTDRVLSTTVRDLVFDSQRRRK